MKLTDATILLGEQSRYFSEVYKLFSFKDDQYLKEYLDFIEHEPVEWVKGLPAKLKTKNTLSRPKAALIKLLKMEVVQTVLGKEYVEKVHDAIWSAFKKNIDAILTKRNQGQSANIVEQMAEPITEAESVHSIGDEEETGPGHAHGPAHCESCAKLEYKYTVCLSALQAFMQDYARFAPGAVGAVSVLLNSLHQL